MATQEEVLQVIIANEGVISFKDLKKHFGLDRSGSSWLPQRLKSLENKRLIYRLRLGNESYFLADPDLLDFDFRGRPAGSVKINLLMEQKLLRFVEERKIASWKQLRIGLRWNKETLNKYLRSLLNKNMLIEWRTGGLVLYMTPASLDEILNEYYNRLYS